jgi:MYXO-CTERM domain-containing protein
MMMHDNSRLPERAAPARHRMGRRTITLGMCAVAGMGLVPRDAHATYSVAATESTTRQVGGASTSCVGAIDMAVVYGSVPGRGVIHAQSLLDPSRRSISRALGLLRDGTAPTDVITAITAESFDPRFAERAYGVVDLMGRAAGYGGARDVIMVSSGALDLRYREARQGRWGSFTYAIQGAALTGRRVLDQTEAGFRGAGCDLPERLMLALEAGAENGEGDHRCFSRGIPSDSAFIEVDEATGEPGSYLRLSVTDTRSVSAVVRLREQFDLWRRTHPCMTVAVDAGVADAGGPARDGGTDAVTAPDVEPPLDVADAAAQDVAAPMDAGGVDAAEDVLADAREDVVRDVVAADNAPAPGDGPMVAADAGVPVAQGNDGCGCRAGRTDAGGSGGLLAIGVACIGWMRRRRAIGRR